MSKKIISVALLAAAALSTGAYAQSYQGGYDSSSPQQQQYQDSSTSAQYYDYQGNESSSPSNYQQQNGQYIDHTGRDSGPNKANPYARDIKDGPMGTSPGA